MRTIADWKRLGSEAQSEDVRAGHTGEITDADLRDLLSAHFDGDLNNPEMCDDYGAALAALVDGYRHGG